jgi:hypothetical protein
MSPTLSEDYLTLELRPSRRLLALFVALYGLAALATSIISAAWYSRVTILCVLLVSAVHVLRRQAFLNDTRAIVHIRCAEGQWWVRGRGAAEEQAATLKAASFWIFGVIVLVFDLQDGGHRSVLLAGDQADIESSRRLRVYIRNRLTSY